MPNVWRQYLAERFPLGAYVVLISAMTFAAVGVAAASIAAPVPIWPILPASTLATLALFFLLRVFDEHKDFASDRIAHPQRVLSRGLVTLAQLARVGVVMAVLSVGLGFALGLHAGLWMLAALGFAVLMRYEFFVGAWLREHLVLYALTHNPVVALLMMVPVAAVLGTTRLSDPVLFWLLAASATSLGFEVGRKLRTPEDEKPIQDTYTQALGIPRAAALLVLVETVVVFATARLVPSQMGQAVVASAFVFALMTAVNFRRTPTRKSAKLAEGGATILALTAYIVIGVDAVLRLGVVWV